MELKINIRPAKKEDCLNLAVLSIQVWLDTYAVDGIRSELSNYVVSNFTETLYLEKLNDKTFPIFVVEKDNHLVGFVMLNLSATFENESNGYEIDTLYVQSHFKGFGLGKKLIQHVQNKFGITCWLHTWINNHNALGFYDYLGFKDVGNMYFDLEGEKHENRVLVLNKAL